MTIESKTKALDSITKAADLGPYSEKIKQSVADAVAAGASEAEIIEAIREGLPSYFRSSAADKAGAEYYAIATDEAARRRDDLDSQLHEVHQLRKEARSEARYRKLVGGGEQGQSVSGNSSHCPRCGGPNSVTGTLCDTCAGHE